ncbi:MULTISPECIES: hypothetical protein [unclassified Burkholderia]|uniref:hypothetical protein n=1 Tax=unclassified Burkholderia TaxID=2613784 RepID=UPI000F55D212|nr:MULTISPECIES: hypothetical protein [unclassified Burkholderia]RQR81472.1 hypothetical protein DIE10_17885 [Burkholderia sp. Bp9011]RQR91049.1 hypothetical protein DIE09_20125 [Burkholderia sp. Bp9010]RQS75196.1 hypothetical protein DID97_16490 [Burkholderia sp. Bp8977]
MSSQLSALGAGIMASAVLAAAMGNATVQEKHLAATAVHPARVYTMNQSIETGSVGGESFFYEVEHNFETEIALFYDRLLNAQKPLGDEFQRVLSQNLWDLYAE